MSISEVSTREKEQLTGNWSHIGEQVEIFIRHQQKGFWERNKFIKPHKSEENDKNTRKKLK